MLVCLIKRSLRLDHTPQPQVISSFTCLFWVSVNTSHALITNIENQADDHWSLCEKCASLDDVIMVKFWGRWVVIEFKCTLNIAKVIILILQKAWNHISKMLLIVLWSSFVRCASITLFLNYSSRIIKRTCRDKAFLPSSSLNIKNKAISWELLSTPDSDNVPWLDVSPVDRQESLDLSGDDEILYLLIVDKSSDLPLSHLKRKILDAHQPKVHRESNYWIGQLNLVIFLWVHDQEEQNDWEHVFEVDDCVDQEIP